MSLEHAVSRGVLEAVALEERAILVRNLTFIASEERKLPINGLASRMLCESHNSRLTDFDLAATQTIRALDAINSTAGKPCAVPERYVINGDHLERWMLKALIGGLFGGTFRTQGPGFKNESPPIEWLRLLFEGARFPQTHGLWVMLPPTDTWESRPAMVRSMVVQAADHRVIGISLELLELRFVLCLADVPSPCPALAGAIHRPRGIAVHGASAEIEFSWADSSPHDLMEFAWAGAGHGPRAPSN
jgi:hypothetical protein